MLRTDLEQAIHCSGEFRNRNAEGLGNGRGGGRRHIAPDLNGIQLAVPHNDLIGRQIVVNVGEVNR